MSLFSFLFGTSSSSSSSVSNSDSFDINPATGLPMTSGIGSVDVAGNPYGTDLSDSLASSIDDSFNSIDSGSCFDDSFSLMDSSCGIDDW